jgi:AcrR family transcriptional regulator
VPTAKGEKQQRGIERQREIVSAAIEEFGRHGYRRRGLRRIADRIGISEAGLFHHFGTKKDLLLAILAERHAQGLRRHEVHLSPGGVDAVRALPELMAATIEERGLAQFTQVMLAESFEPDSHSHQYYLERNRRVREDFAAILKEAVDQLPDAESVDCDVAATLIQAVMDGVQGLWLLDPDNVDPVATLALLRDLLLHRLGDQPTT